MRGTILMMLGLAVTVYTLLERLHSPVFTTYKPVGFAIGCGLIMWGGFERQRSGRK
jgi:hypothetical protein